MCSLRIPGVFANVLLRRIRLLDDRGQTAMTLTPAQLEVLQQYLEFEAHLEEVRFILRGILDFNFVAEAGRRFMDCNFPPPMPGIEVTRQHLDAALQFRRSRRISEQEFVEWATMLFLNQAYDEFSVLALPEGSNQSHRVTSGE
jgi:hypothetical protein